MRERPRWTILLAAFGGAGIVDGADHSSWPSIIIGAVVVAIALADGGRPHPPQPPAANWGEALLRYFGLK